MRRGRRSAPGVHTACASTVAIDWAAGTELAGQVAEHLTLLFVEQVADHVRVVEVGELVDPNARAASVSRVASIEQACVDRQRVLAEKAQMEVAERRGELVSRDEVQCMLDGAPQTLRGQLLQLAPRLAAQLANVSDAFSARSLIDSEVRASLSDLADRLEQTLGGDTPPPAPSDDDTDTDADHDAAGRSPRT